jgi:hypothetical protein
MSLTGCFFSNVLPIARLCSVKCDEKTILYVETENTVMKRPPCAYVAVEIRTGYFSDTSHKLYPV